MNRAHSPSQAFTKDVIHHQCGCEVLISPTGITIGRRRCKKAERLHTSQCLLSKRLMSTPEGSEAERKLISQIERISLALEDHRKRAPAQNTA